MRDDIWRCLVAYGADPEAAAVLADEHDDAALHKAFDAVDNVDELVLSTSSVRVEIELASAEKGELDLALRRLALLSRPQRRAILAHRVVRTPEAMLEQYAGATATDLETGLAVLAGGLSAPDAEHALSSLLAQIADLEAPEAEAVEPSLRGLPAIAVAFAAALLGLAVMSGTNGEADQSASSAASPSITSEAPTTTTGVTTTTIAAFVEPDREVEVEVTDDNTIVRREPWTRRLIWESRPFRSAIEIVSVDPNTVTIDYSGERLLISLADGTFLPP